jgi:hypothetical protein
MKKALQSSEMSGNTPLNNTVLDSRRLELSDIPGVCMGVFGYID